MNLCPVCCRDHAHRLRSASGAMLWRPGLVASSAHRDWQRWLAGWVRWAMDRPRDLTTPARPDPLPEALWLETCTACHGTGLELDLEVRFNELACRWIEGTEALSSPSERLEHPACCEIVAMGKAGLPLVLRAFEQSPWRWEPVLRLLAKVDPVPMTAWAMPKRPKKPGWAGRSAGLDVSLSSKEPTPMTHRRVVFSSNPDLHSARVAALLASGLLRTEGGSLLIDPEEICSLFQVTNPEEWAQQLQMQWSEQSHHWTWYFSYLVLCADELEGKAAKSLFVVLAHLLDRSYRLFDSRWRAPSKNLVSDLRAWAEGNPFRPGFSRALPIQSAYPVNEQGFDRLGRKCFKDLVEDPLFTVREEMKGRIFANPEAKQNATWPRLCELYASLFNEAPLQERTEYQQQGDAGPVLRRLVDAALSPRSHENKFLLMAEIETSEDFRHIREAIPSIVTECIPEMPGLRETYMHELSKWIEFASKSHRQNAPEVPLIFTLKELAAQQSQEASEPPACAPPLLPSQRAVAYLRIPKGHEKRAFVLQAQYNACQQWAEAQGVQVVAVVEDLLPASKNIHMALTRLQEHQAEWLVLSQADRFGRDVLESAQALEFFKNHDKRVIFAESGMATPLTPLATRPPNHRMVWADAEWQGRLRNAKSCVDELGQKAGDPERAEEVRRMIDALVEREKILDQRARALLEVAPRCMACEERLATRRVPEGSTCVDPERCDLHSNPGWPELPQAAAIRGLLASEVPRCREAIVGQPSPYSDHRSPQEEIETRDRVNARKR